MCVIAVCQKQPTIKNLRAMWDANPQGAGVAWSDGKRVHYVKGIMTFDALREIVGKMDGPFVVHTRISTVGGTREDLCHPFVVSAASPLTLKGKTDAVLFHNGHWGDWAENLRLSTVSTGAKMPEGAFSDSRAMAVLCGRHGLNFARLIPDSQRVCVVTPDTITRYGKGWSDVDGMSVSNTNWQPRAAFSGPFYVRNGTGTREWSRTELLLDPPKSKRDLTVEPTLDDVIGLNDPVEGADFDSVDDPDGNIECSEVDDTCQTDFLFPEAAEIQRALKASRK